MCICSNAGELHWFPDDLDPWWIRFPLHKTVHTPVLPGRSGRRVTSAERPASWDSNSRPISRPAAPPHTAAALIGWVMEFGESLEVGTAGGGWFGSEAGNVCINLRPTRLRPPTAVTQTPHATLQKSSDQSRWARHRFFSCSPPPLSLHPLSASTCFTPLVWVHHFSVALKHNLTTFISSSAVFRTAFPLTNYIFSR